MVIKKRLPTMGVPHKKGYCYKLAAIVLGFFIVTISKLKFSVC